MEKMSQVISRIDISKRAGECLILMIFISIVMPISADVDSISNVFSKTPSFGRIMLDGNIDDVIAESDTDERFIFKRISDLEVDSRGNIYLLDDDRILQYGPDGKFIKTVGRKGQGPGEYDFPCKLFVDQGDNLYVNDQGQSLSVYDEAGTFVELIRFKFTIQSFPDNLRRFFVDNSGNIIAVKYEFDDTGLKHVCIKADRKGTIIRNIMDVEQQGIRVRGSSRGGVMGGKTHPYSPGIHFCYVKEGLVCLGQNIDYALHLIDTEGKERTVFGKEEEAEPVTSEEIRSLALDKDDLAPSHRPFFNDILSDEKGRIYVLRVAPLLEKRPMQEIDIFSRDGRYLYNMRTPIIPKVIKKGCFYTFVRDENEKIVVKKIRIPDYDHMKS